MSLHQRVENGGVQQFNPPDWFITEVIKMVSLFHEKRSSSKVVLR
jgi:hypothetical protein